MNKVEKINKKELLQMVLVFLGLILVIGWLVETYNSIPACYSAIEEQNMIKTCGENQDVYVNSKENDWCWYDTLQVHIDNDKVELGYVKCCGDVYVDHVAKYKCTIKKVI